ncbi:uncharacterized protein NMK_2637 [Novimethylophilus kurashikiensis]|uniref:DUF883 domain-containing protein n=1 Tax=Novimethylophilus kurashikiensis TaxID=1825523 RepID=A0A2R5F9Z8_9PROT|nr:hypothetical protein [Novimethylophilus kurashikiensis]GBG15036.1 uncharacterized protein NMK_2637 [Novimethylophilus kurashikiensis]
METSGNFNTATSPSDVQDTIKNTAKPAVERMAAGAHSAVDSIAGAANEAVESLSVKGGQLKDMQSRIVDSSCAYVQEHPMAAIGIAVASGFLLSRLLSSGSR